MTEGQIHSGVKRYTNINVNIVALSHIPWVRMRCNFPNSYCFLDITSIEGKKTVVKIAKATPYRDKDIEEACRHGYA